MPDSLAEIVITEGLLSADVVGKAADAADSARIPLVVSLVRNHGLNEVALVAAFKKHVRVPTLDPAKTELDSDALRELSLDDSRRLRALAISVGIYGAGPRLLRVAMADPTNKVSIAELEHLSGCTIEPFLVTLSAVEEMIETAYKHFVTEVMKRAEVVGSGSAPKRMRHLIKPKTKPFHRVSEEAGAELRTRALVELCIDKGVFERAEYDAMLVKLLKKP